ncbi:MAG: sensor histidine kinase [Catonella sp.]|uniref:sensor histidine kinase n=1 Tax=Catonella sp. TaxID=2382125 RepID=UPI003FA071A3
MKKGISLQWKLTLMTACMVIVACLSISYFISNSAAVYMNEIGNSAIAILPSGNFSESKTGDLEVHLDPKAILSDMVKSTQIEFWAKSLLITLIITLVGSLLMYFIVGYALSPLSRFTRQIEDIQAKNIQQSILPQSKSIEIVRLTYAFNRLLKRLGDTFIAQRQFSASAAHELRTPLAVMRTKFEVFAKNKNLTPDDCKDAICMARTQTDRLSHVIDILLEMTELQSAEKNDHINLEELVEEVICDLTAVGEKKGVSITQNIGSAKLTGSDTLIYRAIYNLIENAIKYNKDNGNIIVSIKEENEFAKVIIADSGSGIVREDWEKIFEPFYRVDKSRSRAMGGAGLGLALVKEIAIQHGGNVKVLESSENGTSIELSLYKG